MRILFLTLVSFLVMNAGIAQVVNIPDANFKAFLVADTLVNTNMDTEIQVSEAVAYTGHLQLLNLGISDMTGIEAFVNLTSLNCSTNNLSTVDVSSNTALVSLKVMYNNIDSIDLSANTQLTTFLGGFNDFEYIDLSNNNLIDTLNMSQCDLINIDLSNLSLLKRMNISHNAISHLDFQTNVNLEYADISYNNLDSLFFDNAPNLIQLKAIADQLSYVDLSNCPSLEYLQLNGNDLNTIDLSANPELLFFEANFNELELIDISANTMLESFHAPFNQLTGLNTINNLQLESVEISNNPLTSFDASHLVNLIEIYTNQCDSLEVLNIANGNNVSLLYHDFSYCPNLTCIQVDDVAYANTNFTNKDAVSTYSLDCGYCFTSYKLIDPAICEGEVYLSPSAQVLSLAGTYFDTLSSSCGSDSIIQINLSVTEIDSTQLPGEDFCSSDTIDFYGTSITTSGTYYHSLSNLGGCDSVVSKTFTQILGVSITNNQGTLEATPNMDSYQWFQDGNALINETTASYTPSADGLYSCEAVLNNCITVSNAITIAGTAIQDLPFKGLKVFPNPCNHVLNVEIEEPISTLKILSVTGKLIQELNPNSRQIDLSLLESGIYLLALTSETKHTVISIVKQ